MALAILTMAIKGRCCQPTWFLQFFSQLFCWHHLPLCPVQGWHWAFLSRFPVTGLARAGTDGRTAGRRPKVSLTCPPVVSGRQETGGGASLILCNTPIIHLTPPLSYLIVRVRTIQVLILYWWPHQVRRKNLQQSFSWGAPSSTGTVISTKTGCKSAVKMIFQGFKPRGHFLLGSDKYHSEIERAFVRLCDNTSLSLKKREN